MASNGRLAIGPAGLALLCVLGLAACGDTWRGMKQDTGENIESMGETMDRTGEDIEESAEEEKTQ